MPNPAPNAPVWPKKCHGCKEMIPNPTKMRGHYAKSRKCRKARDDAWREAAKKRMRERRAQGLITGIPTVPRGQAKNGERIAVHRFCTSCGAKRHKSWAFCGNCGARLY